MGPGRMIATSTTRSSRFSGLDLGSVCIWARDSIWKTPTVSAAWIMRKTSGMSSGSRSRSTTTAQSAVMSLSASSIADSMRRPSRSSLISLIVSMSRLSYWTTTRPGMVARSSGAMSISGAAVMSMPPVWIDRWRGKPSMRAVSSSHRSHGDMSTVEGRSGTALESSGAAPTVRPLTVKSDSALCALLLKAALTSSAVVESG